MVVWKLFVSFMEVERGIGSGCSFFGFLFLFVFVGSSLGGWLRRRDRVGLRGGVSIGIVVWVLESSY